MEKNKIKYILDHYLYLAPLEIKGKLKYPYLQELEIGKEKQKIAEIIIKNYGDKVFLNNCSKCGELARTPTAKQCRYCENKW